MIVKAHASGLHLGVMSPGKTLKLPWSSSEAKFFRLLPCNSFHPHPCPKDFDASARFSALKMDGMPLYEYARKGIPLPRPIERRKVTIHSLDLVEWKGKDHTFRWPEKQFSDEEKIAMKKALEGIEENTAVKDEPDPGASGEPPTAFVLSMKVSGGTYVRSIVHDLGHAVGSAAHVVTLTRSRQSRFTLELKEPEDKGCVPWEVFQRASEDEGDVDEDGWKEWEREVLDRLEIVDGKKNS
jgi:tRNA pseudouridine55 synthase